MPFVWGGVGWHGLVSACKSNDLRETATHPSQSFRVRTHYDFHNTVSSGISSARRARNGTPSGSMRERIHHNVGSHARVMIGIPGEFQAVIMIAVAIEEMGSD